MLHVALFKVLDETCCCLYVCVIVRLWCIHNQFKYWIAFCTHFVLLHGTCMLLCSSSNGSNIVWEILWQIHQLHFSLNKTLHTHFHFRHTTQRQNERNIFTYTQMSAAIKHYISKLGTFKNFNCKWICEFQHIFPFSCVCVCMCVYEWL